MAAPASGSTLSEAAESRIDVRGWLAALPVRFDDRRFWPRAALGLLLRWMALEAEWRPLREGVARAAAATLRAGGMAVEASGDRLSVGAATVLVTTACVHVDVLGLTAPLLWDRGRSIARNVLQIAVIAAALIAVAVIRIDVAAALLAAGVPWTIGHDLLLGVGYFLYLAAVLRHGAWTRAPR